MGISADEAVDESVSPNSANPATTAPALSRHALRRPGEEALRRPGEEALRRPGEEGAGRSEAERSLNLPNIITMLRAGMVPVLLLLPLFPGERGSAAIAWIFILAAVSDLVDGWLARRGQQVTTLGKLLDPLADKLLVSTALIVLLGMGRIPLWAAWMVVTIVGRELAVTGLRGIASAGGQVVAANRLGKAKTLLQNIAIGALLFHYETLGLDANAVGMVCLTVATFITLASGYGYFADYFRGLGKR